MTTVTTVGHGTLGADELASLLQTAGVEVLVDVRSYPGSRRHPHVAREAMERWVPEAGLRYVWERRLGGRRRPGEGSPHVALRNEQFRAYADHMAGTDFAAALDELVDLAGRSSTAVMCAESVWWRCHRRLLADALVLRRGVRVEHLFHDGRRDEHPPTPEVRLEGDLLVYDLGADRPLPGDG